MLAYLQLIGELEWLMYLNLRYILHQLCHQDVYIDLFLRQGVRRRPL